MEFNLDEALPVLERTPRVLKTQLTGLPEIWTRVTEGGDSWSIYDVAGHLVHGERTDWIARLKIILGNGPDKHFTPFNRLAQFEESRGKTLQQLLDEFEHLRLRNLAYLESLNLTESQLDLTGIHPAFGLVTLRQLLSTWVAHDLSHLAQVNRIMALQYHDAVGPWKEYLSLMKQKPVYYFAYASNLNPARMRQEKHVFYRERKPATLGEYALEFNKRMELPGQGYGNIMPRKNSVVEGALYVVSEPEMELLKKADGWPDQYEVNEVTVTCNGRLVQALTLVACAGQLGEGLKPLRSYLDHILAGKDLMSPEYYQNLLHTSTLD